MKKKQLILALFILISNISLINANKVFTAKLDIDRATSKIVPDCTFVINPINGSTNVPVNSDLQWASVNNVTGYKITIGTTSGGTDIENNADLGNTTSYTPSTNWLENTTYYVTVIAYNNSGDASDCTETTFTTGTIFTVPNCTAVTNPTDGSTNVPVNSDLQWASVNNATGYKITIGTTPGGTDIENNADLADTTTYTPSTNWLENTTYYVTVIAYNGTGDAVGCVETTFITENQLSSNDFVITWKTDNPGDSNDTSITIPTTESGYNYEVDWNNDGVFEQTGISGNMNHDFGAIGTYTIRIRGIFPRIYFNNAIDKDKIISINQWGNQQWTSMENAFYGCSNLVGQATDTPDLSIVTSMKSMFFNAHFFNQDISNWNTSNVTTMERMFFNAHSFNQNIGSWNTGSVFDMRDMFVEALSFNQNLETWNIQSLTSASGMFTGVTLSTVNYDALLIGWESQPHNDNVTFGGGNSKYCTGEASRASMIGVNGWVISDGGLDCTVGVEDHVLSSIEIYPNPSKGGIYNLFWNNESKMTIKVVNINGKIILPNTEINYSNNYHLNLSSHASGVYFVEFTSNNKKAIKKLLLLDN